MRIRLFLAFLFALIMAAVAAAPAQAATSWTVLSTPNRGTIANELYGSAALSASSAWAVGSWYDTGRAAPRTLTERWNGTSWSTVTSPNPTVNFSQLRGVNAISATNAWAVGCANGTSGEGEAPIQHLARPGWATSTAPDPGPPGNTHV